MLSSLPIFTQAFGIDVVAAAARARPSGSATPRRRPPPAAAPVFRKSRREKSVSGSMSRSLLAGRAVDGGPNARVGPAAADVARHGGVDVSVRGLGLDGEQGGCAHDLAHLAVTTLGHVQRRPGRLHLLADGRGAEALDGRDLLAHGQRGGRAARAHRLAVDVHGAGAAEGHPASELGAGQAESVAQDPEQRRGRVGVDTSRLAVDIESDHALLPPDGWAAEPTRWMVAAVQAGRVVTDYYARSRTEVKEFEGPAVSPAPRAACGWQTWTRRAGRGRSRPLGRTFRRRAWRTPPPAWPGGSTTPRATPPAR